MIKVLAVKLTEDVESTKILYEKNGKKYVRCGGDGFSKGLPTNQENLLYQFGYKKVDGDVVPEFRDGKHISENIQNFHLTRNNTVNFTGR